MRPFVLIYSAEHGYYWRPNSAGYTAARSEAGRYPREMAQQLQQALPGKHLRIHELAQGESAIPASPKPSVETGPDEDEFFDDHDIRSCGQTRCSSATSSQHRPLPWGWIFAGASMVAAVIVEVATRV